MGQLGTYRGQIGLESDQRCERASGGMWSKLERYCWRGDGGENGGGQTKS